MHIPRHILQNRSRVGVLTKLPGLHEPTQNFILPHPFINETNVAAQPPQFLNLSTNITYKNCVFANNRSICTNWGFNFCVCDYLTEDMKTPQPERQTWRTTKRKRNLIQTPSDLHPPLNPPTDNTLNKRRTIAKLCKNLNNLWEK